jgi:glycosyltransferase involved in cell wall biosynthesis
MMRIGFVCTRFFPPDGSVVGGEVFVLTLAERLQRLGHYPVVITSATAGWHGPAKDSVRGIPVYRFGPSKIRPHFLSLRLQYRLMVERIVAKEKLDLVECWDERGMLLSKQFACPLVVRMHQNGMVRRRQTGRPPSRIEDFFERRMLRIADVRVGVSEWVAKTTLEIAGLSHLDYRVIYNGVDTAVFAPTSSVEADADLVLFAGQLVDHKGLPTLLEAIQTVMLRRPQTRLRCVGANQKEPGYPSSAERYLSSFPSRLRPRVDFAGAVPPARMPDEFRRAGLCVFPSTSEGLGIVVLEAMACGAPVIYMKDGVGPEVVTHGVDGLLCDTRNPDSLASTILRALSSLDLRRSLGARARQKVEAKFSLDKTTSENVRLYEELANKRHGAHGP